MLLSRPMPGYFAEFNDHSVLLARTSAQRGVMTLEEVRECPAQNPGALAEAIEQIQSRKNPSGFLHAVTALYPARRLIRRHTLDLKRVREPAYFNEICTQQFRIEQDKYALALINADDGADFDQVKATQKEVVFCGLPFEDAEAAQQSLLDAGIYPERMELGSVAVLGAVTGILNASGVKAPVLVLEMGADTTHSYIVSGNGIEASRPIAQGVDAMLPVVQKELALNDEDAARKLFYSNTFDFGGMGPQLTRRLLKELQSSIGFYEVQTGQSVGQILVTQLSPKLAWLEGAIAGGLGLAPLRCDPVAWLQSQGQVAVPEALAKTVAEPRWFGLLSLLAQHSSAHAVVAEEKK
jgi:hypothetical protein